MNYQREITGVLLLDDPNARSCITELRIEGGSCTHITRSNGEYIMEKHTFQAAAGRFGRALVDAMHGGVK